MTTMAGHRRALGVFATVLALAAAGAPAPAAAADGAGNAAPQAVCDQTWWIQTSGPNLADQNSPLMYYAANTSIQFKVRTTYSYRRTLSNCSVQYTKGGLAEQYRYHTCSNGSCSYGSWRNVTRGCGAVEPTKYKGYNYGRGYCNVWSAS